MRRKVSPKATKGARCCLCYDNPSVFSLRSKPPPAFRGGFFCRMSAYDRRRRGKLSIRAALHAEKQTFVRFMVCVISGNHKRAPVHRIAKPRADLAAASRRKTIAYPPQKPCSPAWPRQHGNIIPHKRSFVKYFSELLFFFDQFFICP